MRAQNLSLSFGTTVVFDGAEFNLQSRDKVGIVGQNGAGKSTLLKLILGQLQPDAGTIDTSGARIGYLPQVLEISDMGQSVWDFLMSGREIAALESQLTAAYQALADNPDDAAAATAIDNIQAQLDQLDYYHAEDALLELIENMGIDSAMLDMKMEQLSGGQKSRVAFTRMLYSMPSIMVLDEPTNHLDATTKDFVTDYLKRYKAMVLIVSHDREFLNAVVGKILFVDKLSHKISVIDGNYDKFVAYNAARRRAMADQRAAQDRQIEKLNNVITRARGASPTNHALKRLGHVRAAMLDKILAARIVREQEYKKIKMDLRPKNTGAKMPIIVDDLWFRFSGGPLMYRKMSFYITRGERFLIVGPNGAGKSTLLKLIMGILQPTRGTIEINPKTEIAYYAQELELLDLDKTVLENVASDEYTELQLRSALANFLFTGTDVAKRVSMLSPGERARVALCRMLLRRANLLILDEPTNHLDPETQMLIADNFREYDGTIIVVSHNAAFVDQIGISRMLVLPSGEIRDFSPDEFAEFDITEQ